MKKIDLLLLTMLVMLTGCHGQRQIGDVNLITLNYTNIFSPQKELILQDFMDVEYIALETKDVFLHNGKVEDIGEEFILISNIRNGDVFVYDRTGKALRRFNRMGRGGDEYIRIAEVVLDEENHEIFVYDRIGRKIVVYDLFGKFKRYFKLKEGAGAFYADVFNYDKKHLICYYDNYDEDEENSFILVSKLNGNIIKEIQIPYKEKKRLEQALHGETINIVTPSSPRRRINPLKDGNWLLFEFSSDTAYTFLTDYSLRPFMARSPSIQSTNPEVFILLRLHTDRYIFIETIINEYNFTTRQGFPTSYMMYDKKEKAMFRYTVYNGDFVNKQEVYMNAATPINHKIESCYPLDAYRLVESYKKGELKGKLKEIAATLKEDDNPVIMLIKHKNNR